MSRQIVFITRISNEESGGVDKSCVKNFSLGLSKKGKKQEKSQTRIKWREPFRRSDLVFRL